MDDQGRAPNDGQGRREYVRSTLRTLARTGDLPALPQAALAALAVARDPNSDADSLCDVIRVDVGLAARVTHVANAAAYTRRVPARTLKDAVSTLGLRKTCDILVAASFRRFYTISGPQAQALWDHALAVALAAEELARVTRVAAPGEAFLPGLFHDAGRIVFLLADPTALELIQGIADAGGGDRIALERNWCGVDHAEAGSVLLADWGIPPDQCEAIRWHHQPARAGSAAPLASLLSAADALAYAIGYGAGNDRPPATALRDFGLTPEDEGACAERVHVAFAQESALLA